jgi:hypothetical protein
MAAPDDRPRLVLCLTDGGKPAVCFQLGCALALRQIGLLRQVKVLCAVGSGMHVLQLLLAARTRSVPIEHGNFAYRSWDKLVTLDPDAEFDPLKEAVDHATRVFMPTNFEAEIALSRICRPSRWLDDWQSELLEMPTLCTPIQLDDIDVVKDRDSHLHRGETPRYENPVFLFQCATRDDKLLCYTNDPYCPTSSNVVVEFVAPNSCIDTRSVAVAGALPERFDRGKVYDRSGVRNARQLDPLALHAAQIYFTNERLMQFFGAAEVKKNDHPEASRVMLLLDGYSYSTAFSRTDPEQTRHKVTADLEVLTGPEDRNNEGIRAYKQQPLQMLSRVLLETDESGLVSRAKRGV